MDSVAEILHNFAIRHKLKFEIFEERSLLLNFACLRIFT